MYPAVCKNRPSRQTLSSPEKPLYQHIEGVCAEVGQKEQGDAQMSDGQADE